MRKLRMLLLTTLAALAVVAVMAPRPASAFDIEYACSPSVSTWTTKGAWGDGTVLESRTCLREDGLGDVRAYSYWRTRRGGTAIQSDWNLGGSNAILQAWVHSRTTGFDYGVKQGAAWNDVFNTSIVMLASFPDCSTVSGNDLYTGYFHGVQANPNGSLPASGFKDSDSHEANNDLLDCGI